MKQITTDEIKFLIMTVEDCMDLDPLSTLAKVLRLALRRVEPHQADEEARAELAAALAEAFEDPYYGSGSLARHLEEDVKAAPPEAADRQRIRRALERLHNLSKVTLEVVDEALALEEEIRNFPGLRESPPPGR